MNSVPGIIWGYGAVEERLLCGCHRLFHRLIAFDRQNPKMTPSAILVCVKHATTSLGVHLTYCATALAVALAPSFMPTAVFSPPFSVYFTVTVAPFLASR